MAWRLCFAVAAAAPAPDGIFSGGSFSIDLPEVKTPDAGTGDVPLAASFNLAKNVAFNSESTAMQRAVAEREKELLGVNAPSDLLQMSHEAHTTATEKEVQHEQMEIAALKDYARSEKKKMVEQTEAVEKMVDGAADVKHKLDRVDEAQLKQTRMWNVEAKTLNSLEVNEQAKLRKISEQAALQSYLDANTQKLSEDLEIDEAMVKEETERLEGAMNITERECEVLQNETMLMIHWSSMATTAMNSHVRSMMDIRDRTKALSDTLDTAFKQLIQNAEWVEKNYKDNLKKKRAKKGSLLELRTDDSVDGAAPEIASSLLQEGGAHAAYTPNWRKDTWARLAKVWPHRHGDGVLQ